MNIAQDAIGTSTRIDGNADGQRTLAALLDEPTIATRCNSLIRIGDETVAMLRIGLRFAIIEIGLPSGNGFIGEVCDISFQQRSDGHAPRLEVSWPSGRGIDPASIERTANALRIAAGMLAHLQTTPEALDGAFAAFDALVS